MIEINVSNIEPVDEDTQVLYSVSITNNSSKSEIKFYEDYRFFKEFAEKIIEFPFITKKMILESRQKEFYINLFSYDLAGHCAMEVKIEENRETPFYHMEHFFILREAENFRNLLNEMK